MDDIEDKIKNLGEWTREREKIKPIIDVAVDYHNKARSAVNWKNYELAADFYRAAIKNYKDALALKPKYYLQDLLSRVDQVMEEHVNNTFNLKISGDRLKNKNGIREFINFINGLKEEERKYIDPYDIAHAFFRIGDLYYEEGSLKEAYEFYNTVIDIGCERSFVNRDAYLKTGRILFEQQRFKEALVNFVSVLSFDRANSEAISYLEICLGRLGISEHKHKFLVATPNEARKLIMEVL